MIHQKFSDTEEVILDEDTHRYWVDRQRVPGVSEVLGHAGLQTDYGEVPSWILSRASSRGTRVHEMASQILTEGFDLASLDEECEPYVFALIDWLVDQPDKDIIGSTIITEETLSAASYCGLSYAGTTDWVHEYLDGYRVVDFKTSAKQSVFHRIQVSAYMHLVEQLIDCEAPVYGGILYLNKDGESNFVDVEYDSWWDRACETFVFKMEHGEIGGFKRKRNLH